LKNDYTGIEILFLGCKANQEPIPLPPSIARCGVLSPFSKTTWWTNIMTIQILGAARCSNNRFRQLLLAVKWLLLDDFASLI
jgi:hypothetical protein